MGNKFKPGDVIRIGDRKDPGYESNHLYEIVSYNEEFKHYDIRSFARGYVRNVSEFAQLGISVKKVFEEAYRLATPTEILLYGRKEIQKD